MNILALNLSTTLAAAIEQEAARHGLSAAAWIAERLAERFGLPASEARG